VIAPARDIFEQLGTRNSERLFLRLYTAFWILVCVAHTCQTIIFSGGQRLPGSLVDSRFNNLILEHLNAALHGSYAWWSPA